MSSSLPGRKHMDVLLTTVAATLCNLLEMGCALRHCRRVPSQSEVRQRREEEKDSLPFSREFGPSSTLGPVLIAVRFGDELSRAIEQSYKIMPIVTSAVRVVSTATGADVSSSHRGVLCFVFLCCAGP